MSTGLMAVIFVSVGFAFLMGFLICKIGCPANRLKRKPY